jgi:hypothetical protein
MADAKAIDHLRQAAGVSGHASGEEGPPDVALITANDGGYS